jgi:hypothetical protein
MLQPLSFHGQFGDHPSRVLQQRLTTTGAEHMKYAKPEVVLVNAATAAIQGSGKTGLGYDNPIMKTHVTVPAYEADE